jgi:hypothetical protein
MPDLSITAASVETVASGSQYLWVTAGETVTAGMPVYKKASDTKYYKADANDSAGRVLAGIALHGSLANQPLRIQVSGSLDIGATLIPGEFYVLSDNVGGICPASDLMVDAGDYLVPVGYATAADNLLLCFNANAQVLTAKSGYLTKQSVIDRVIAATSVGTTTITSDILDMQGYDSVTFIVLYGTITDGPPSIKISQGNDSGLSDGADLAGTALAVTNGDDGKLCVEELVKPTDRYVQLSVVRGGATGCVLDGAIAIRTRTLTDPTTQGSDVAAIEQHLSPAEGTA